ncbi:Uncharacterised protein [Segatella copri]|nr:Uncharacterised protein [Segatella copri]
MLSASVASVTHEDDGISYSRVIRAFHAVLLRYLNPSELLSVIELVTFGIGDYLILG